MFLKSVVFGQFAVSVVIVPQKRLNLVYKNGLLFHFPRKGSVPQKEWWKEHHLHKRGFVRSTNLLSFSARNKVIPMWTILLCLPFVSMPVFLNASKSGLGSEYKHSPLYVSTDLLNLCHVCTSPYTTYKIIWGT